ncbi:MAG: phospholipase D family protein [Pseudomonadota bacterium]|nr:phospholipase D family protein [Pseudomonadota bacterium]
MSPKQPLSTLRLCRCALALALWGGWMAPASAVDEASMALIDTEINAHTGKTGSYVLDSGEQALRARAWLADNALTSIDVQYFIWSTDNIGKLAAAALLRAADRGVRVRVIIDDLLVDAPAKSLLALALHPNIDIRIYNPKSSVGVPLAKRALNVVTDFAAVNQRMHDKTLIVDGKIGITGGRNMAAEYFDYNHRYNFRDRDALLLGPAVKSMQESFERFWNSKLSVRVEDRFNGLGLMRSNVSVKSDEVQEIYRQLHEYARSTENFSPQVRAAIEAIPGSFARLAQQMAWGEVEFISDMPGKSQGPRGPGPGAPTKAALARLAESAQKRIVIQSPYLVMSEEAIELFRRIVARGVTVRINTNSLAATDNLPAFSGYQSERARLLEMGLQIYEYKPAAEAQLEAMRRVAVSVRRAPISALHAKTMVVDSKTVYIGTFNFDPRSANLNTEVGAIIHDETLARAVEATMETDMAPANSWSAKDNPDRYASPSKRNKVRLYRTLPIQPLL